MVMIVVENWKDIPEWEGYYQASTIGRIRTVSRFIDNGRYRRTVPARILKPSLCYGYQQVVLQKNKYKLTRKVHLLVAETFIAVKPRPAYCVHHIDGNKLNNTVENLAWMFLSEHSVMENMGSYLMSSPSGEITEILNMAKFCRDNNLYDTNMHKVLSGKREHHKGWRKCNTVLNMSNVQNARS
jgi:hypothetical protein